MDTQRCQNHGPVRLLVPLLEFNHTTSTSPGLTNAIALARPARSSRFPDARSSNRCRLSTPTDRKSTRLNSSHTVISYAVFCLKKKQMRRLMRMLDRPHESKAHTT